MGSTNQDCNVADTVYLETISSSSDFSDSPVSSSGERVSSEQRRKEILYCFICQETYGDTCWKENHVVFDISDIIRVAIGPHIIPFYETITNVDRASDQRQNYSKVLNAVKASLRLMKKDVDNKIVENNREIVQLLAAKNELTSRRDNFLSARNSSDSDREEFRNYIEECGKTLTARCAIAAQLDQQYASVNEAYLKLTIERQNSSNWSTRVLSSIDGPISLLNSEVDETYSVSAAEHARRIVAYALTTAQSTDGRNSIIDQDQNELSNIRAPAAAPRNLRMSSLSLQAQPVYPRLPPPPVRQSDLLNANRFANPETQSSAPPSMSTPSERQAQSVQPVGLPDAVPPSYPPPNLPASSPPQSSMSVSSSIQQHATSSLARSNSELQSIQEPEIETDDNLYEVPDAPPTDGGRFAIDRIRSAFKNTCTWNPSFNWLASTSDGADALVWVLPPPVGNSLDKKKKGKPTTSAPTPETSEPNRDDTNKPIRIRLDHFNDCVCQMTWDPTGKILATGSKTGVVRFWSMESNISPSRPPEADTMEERHTNEVLVMKFSPSGKYLISGGIDSKILAWDVERLCLKQIFSFHLSSVCDVDWKAGSNTFASCSYDGAVMISRIGQHQPLRSIMGYPRWIKSVRWNLHGDLLASCSVDTTLEIWKDGSENSNADEFTGHTRSVNAIAWRPVPSTEGAKKDLSSNQYLASGSDDGVVILWNITAKTKVPLNSKNKSSVKCISFSPDGEYIAAGREDGQLDFWLVKKGKHCGSFKLRNTVHKIDWDVTGTRVGAAVGPFGADFVEFSKLIKRSSSFSIPFLGKR